MARPPLADGERQNKDLRIRARPALYELFQRAAVQAELSLSSWGRLRLKAAAEAELSSSEVDPDDAEASDFGVSSSPSRADQATQI